MFPLSRARMTKIIVFRDILPEPLRRSALFMCDNVRNVPVLAEQLRSGSRSASAADLRRASTTRTAISVWSSTRSARRTRSSPSVPSSSSARRVDDNHRTEGEQLHRLAAQGRSSYRLHIGNYGQAPARSQRLTTTGFARIAQTEKADVYALRRMPVHSDSWHSPPQKRKSRRLERADVADMLELQASRTFSLGILFSSRVDQLHADAAWYPHSRSRPDILQASSARSGGSS